MSNEQLDRLLAMAGDSAAEPELDEAEANREAARDYAQDAYFSLPPLWRAAMERPRRIAFGAGMRRPVKNEFTTGWNFLEREFAPEKVAPAEKDGRLYLQTIRKGDLSQPRDDTNAGAVTLIALDLDRGEDWGAIIDRLELIGVGCWVHTSYSHGTIENNLCAAGGFENWLARQNQSPSLENVKTFMLSKKYARAYVETARTFEVIDGRLYVVTAPITKARIVFPLLTDVELTVEQLEYVHRVLAALLDVEHDNALCNKLSQPVFTPRLKTSGAEYRLHVVNRPPLDVHRLIAFGEAEGIKASEVEFIGRDRDAPKYRPPSIETIRTLGDSQLKRAVMDGILAKFSHALEAASLIDDYCGAAGPFADLDLSPHWKAQDDGSRLLVINCPSGDEHTGGKNEHPAHVVNASEGRHGYAGGRCKHTCHEAWGLAELIWPILERLDPSDLEPYILEFMKAEFGAYIATFPKLQSALLEEAKEAKGEDDVSAVLEGLAKHRVATLEPQILDKLAELEVDASQSDNVKRAMKRDALKRLKERLSVLRKHVNAKDREDEREARREAKENNGGGAVASASFNERYAIVINEKKTDIYATPPAPAQIQLRELDALRLEHLPRKAQFETWLSSDNRRMFQDVKFAPAEPLEFQGPKGRTLNKFRGWMLTPAAGDSPLDWGRARAHIYNVLADGDPLVALWYMSWLSDVLQNPGELPGTAVALYSQEGGAGKSIVAELLKDIFGPYFLKMETEDQVIGRFNTQLEGKLFGHAEEMGFGGNRVIQSRIKELVSGTTRNIEAKGRDVRLSVETYMRIQLATNETWMLHADKGERRWLVSSVSEARAADKAYFMAMVDEWRSGGGNRVALRDLLNFHIPDQVNIRAVPHTKLWGAQKARSMGPIDSFIQELLESESLPYNGGRIRLWDHKGRPLEKSNIEHGAMLEAVEVWARRRNQGHIKHVDIEEAWERIGGPMPRPRVRSNIIGAHDALPDRPRCYGVDDLATMRQGFADQWKIEVAGVRPTARNARTAAIQTIAEDDVRRFAAWMLSVDEREVTAEMLRRSQLIERGLIGWNSSEDARAADAVQDALEEAAEKAAEADVEAVPDIDDAA